MEKKFLLYALYVALIDIRERSCENDDRRTFWLTNLLHNVPLHIDSDEEVEETLRRVFENAESCNLTGWMNKRLDDFNRHNAELGRIEIVFKPL